MTVYQSSMAEPLSTANTQKSKKYGRHAQLGGGFFIPFLMAARIGMLIYRGIRIARLARAAIQAGRAIRAASRARKVIQSSRALLKSGSRAGKNAVRRHAAKFGKTSL